MTTQTAAAARFRPSLWSALARNLIVAMPLLLALAVGAQPVSPAPNYEQQLAAARTAYFADVDGADGAAAKAASDFAKLHKAHPHDAVVDAYLGSLDLLAAARTWSLWDKHALSEKGLAGMDNAVAQAPANLEVRFVRAVTTWNLPYLFHRKKQSEQDFTYIASRAEAAARNGTLPPMLAAAALDYYGRVLADRSDHAGAAVAFEAAIRVDSASPGAKDASKRLHGE